MRQKIEYINFLDPLPEKFEPVVESHQVRLSRNQKFISKLLKNGYKQFGHVYVNGVINA